MEIVVNNQRYEVIPWQPDLGRITSGPFAFDCETTMIDDDNPRLVPAYVIGAAFNGTVGYFVTRRHLAAFWLSHRGIPSIFHNAAFDLSVIHAAEPALQIYDAVDQDKVWCTRLLHRLLRLGTAGDVASGRGESTLESCAMEYLGIPVPKDVADQDGDTVRLSYGKWLGHPPGDMYPVYLEYLARDVVATGLLYVELARRLQTVLHEASCSFGFVDNRWLLDAWRRHGPQTHHIQLKSSIVLREITANGLHLDADRKGYQRARLASRVEELREELRQQGYLAGSKGAEKALQSIIARLERNHPGSRFPRTPTGKIATSKEALQDLAASEPFVRKLLEFKAGQKLLTSFVNKLNRPVLHPSFDPLTRTARTSSFGMINAQNLPRTDDVRACFVPSPGHVFIDADYSTVELATLAAACQAQFRLPSQMAAAINAGQDLHRLVAARVTGKAFDDVSKLERQKAKAINFGRPGGMGPATLQAYAKASYEVNLSEEEVQTLLRGWEDLFPEMPTYLQDNIDVGQQVAEQLGLTPAAHHAATGSARFLYHPQNQGRGHLPHKILGAMALKVLRDDQPCLGNGTPYPAEEVAWFWEKLQQLAVELPPPLAADLLNRRPGYALWKCVAGRLGRGPVVTLTGRVRAEASYAARHNTIFQGLAADGAKLALWRLWRAGFRIVNFIHDEMLVEVPEVSDLRNQAEQIKAHMIAGMAEVVPGVRIDVSYAACDRWYKNAEAIIDNDGCLHLWRPALGDDNGDIVDGPAMASTAIA